MAAKTVWLCWVPAGEAAPQPQATVQAMGQVGLAVSGAPWADDLDKVAWSDLAEQLAGDAAPDILGVAGRVRDFDSPTVRYGLSLTLARALAGRPQLKVVLLGLDGVPPREGLPTLMQQAEILDASQPAWAAKLVALAFAPGGPVQRDHRLDVIAHAAIGQWLEIGPAHGHWDGAMLGISGEDVAIEQHAVGAKGQLPERTVLNYASKGIQAELGGEAFEIWSVQNRLGPEDSYFVKVKGFPRRVIFAGHDGRADGEVTVLTLQ
ncbi:MAG: hypothetical protein ACFB22_14440 [Rhodothalassiaceae bacterium]